MTSGWDTLNAAVAAVRAEIAAAAPNPGVAAEGEAYVARVLTACLTDTFLSHLLTEGGLGRALPTRGGPSPDYLMLHAAIDPSRRYRLEGRLNESERVGVGLYAFAENGATLQVGYAAFDHANVGKDGRFTLDIAADAGGPGTLAITPTCRAILVRILHRDAGGQPARLTLSGGASTPGLTLATGTPDGALARSAQALGNSVRQFLVWTRATAAHPNRFITPPPEIAATVQGDPDTLYYLGYFDLQDGEWLEARLPSGLRGYWSIHAYNHWCEALQTQGVHDLNAVPDADGGICVRIGPTVPAAFTNRIDTIGRRRGVLICRMIGCKSGLPETRVIRGT